MASSILNSDDGVISGTSGLKSTGGDDGVLVFQSKGTETARVNTDKQIVAAAGTASLPVLTTTGDLNTGIYFPAADNIGFATNGVIRGRWTTAGLCFGSDTAAANALDDYEEGTWTPTLSVGTATVYLQQWYTKVGNLVTIYGYLYSFTNTSSTSDVVISGLPFATAANNFESTFLFSLGATTNLPAGAIGVHGRFGQNGSDSIGLIIQFQSSTATNLKYNNLGGVHLQFTATYRAA